VLQCVAVCCSALTFYDYNPHHLAIVLEASCGLPTDEYFSLVNCMLHVHSKSSSALLFKDYYLHLVVTF